ncbi:MAG: 5-formyltetrahydrofolate cyclo-ligase [Verrucomicrobiaceae bacterium]|nr:5-formyltetrahydrofolate cyclo-ligase [Verrucomicrobiaceae bacterium]
MPPAVSRGSFNVSSSETDKRQLRRTLRTQRRALSVFAQRRAARQLLQRVIRLPWFLQANSIAFYLAADGEIDPFPLIQHAWRCGKRTFLPGLRAGNRLVFLEYRAGSPMRVNRLGISEPYGVLPVALNALDAVCLPLVGFDRASGRLGMGGGFYDRTLARRTWNGPRLIGLAHSLQQCEHIPRDAWDIPLREVVTERQWIRVRR